MWQQMMSLSMLIVNHMRMQQYMMFMMCVCMMFTALMISRTSNNCSRKRKRDIEGLVALTLASQAQIVASCAAAYYSTLGLRDWWVKGRSNDWFNNLILVGGTDEDYMEHYGMSR